MKYKRIELINACNLELDLLLYQISKWHNLTPKLWMPEYIVTEVEIEEAVQRIKNTKAEDLFLMVAEDDEKQVRGFIWAYRKENQQDSIMILSLYITEEFRGRGIATQLKQQLEEWCKSKGINTIHTTTHYNNHSMLELNQKLGYLPGMVSMTKVL